MGTCDPGLCVRRDVTIEESDTALAHGSGDVPVLATPRVLALAEAACVEAISGELPETETTVGSFAEIEHHGPSPVGATVHVEATLIGHHGRRLEFNIIFRMHDEVVARVQHRRVIVDRDRFLSKLEAAKTA